MKPVKDPFGLRMPSGDPRRYRRFDVQLTASVVPVPTKRVMDFALKQYRHLGMPVALKNLSATGLLFVSEREYRIWQQLWMIVIIGEKSIPVRGMVRRVFHYDDSGDVTKNGYGIQFLRSEFAETAVSEFIDYLTRIALTEPKRR